jgi:NitT/TauT family transport system ATP-binding protein
MSVTGISKPSGGPGGAERGDAEPTVRLRADRLSMAFDQPFEQRPRQVLDEVSLAVQAGEFVSIVGASGCGKTTLLRILAGLIRPTGGDVLLDGASITGPSDACGFVFQQDQLMPWRTVAANVAVGLEVRGWPKSERRERVAQALQMVRLERWGRHFPRELSGGMRQRVNIARALALEPEVFLMDEPFAALDAQTREMMQDELQQLCARLGSTVVFVTHQIDEAVFLGDRVIVLAADPGRIREEVIPGLPRPRHVESKRTPEFAAVVQHIWGLIAAEVRRSMQQEIAAAGEEKR